MSHLNRIYTVCKFSIFCLWHLEFKCIPTALFFYHFSKERSFCDFLFAPLDDAVLQKWCLLLKDEWMTCHFTSFSTVFQSYERLCAIEFRLQLRRFHLERG